MTITREYAEQFLDVLMTRDPERIAPYLADDVDWLIVGPIELFSYCGQHFGKEAVLAAYGQLNTRTVNANYSRDFVVTDGECASALTRIDDIHRPSGNEVVVRLAQFARFRDGKVTEFCSIVDTLGAAEQVLGRALLPAAAAPALAG
jgi:ketosteroid isomerase-like protein